MTLRYRYVVAGLAPETRVMGFIEANTSGEVEQWVRQAFFERWGYRCSSVHVTVGEYDA